eukprot:TRINITY_DN10069_c0_g2_i1.p1 TRINITY_DN10069_c0_g2~~TRINITY_DN10069_c0_g2_i1.p1  ORF type:complete len:196 (+),score=27.86 TRINITY_DN10069_c0_g2_i1:235-822(+)
MRILHCGNFWSEEEIDCFKEVIRSNLLSGMKDVLEYCAKFKYEPEPDNLKHVRYLSELDSSHPVDNLIYDKLETLWKDPAVLRTWDEMGSYQLLVTHLDYYLSRIQFIRSPDFTPNDEDILRCRYRTTGAVKTEFVVIFSFPTFVPNHYFFFLRSTCTCRSVLANTLVVPLSPSPGGLVVGPKDFKNQLVCGERH